MSNEVVINVQPSTTHQEVYVEKAHLCMCERGCKKTINYIICMPDGVNEEGTCGTTPRDFCYFRVDCLACPNDDGLCLGILCFPITFPLKLLCQAPCIGYNMSRNKCNGTTGLEYVC
jgi:hypothetical protein